VQFWRGGCLKKKDHNQHATQLGKRLFKRWVCHPLRSISAIYDRQNAVQDLNSVMAIQGNFDKIFNYFFSRIDFLSIKVNVQHFLDVY